MSACIWDSQEGTQVPAAVILYIDTPCPTELLGLGAQLSRPHLVRAIDRGRRVGIRVGRRRRVVLLLLRQLRVPRNLRRGCGLLLRLVSRAIAARGGAHTPARTALRRVWDFLWTCARL